MKKSKLLVTGGAGFIGSNFVKKALNIGHDVVVIDNLSTGKEENVDERATFYDLDLSVSGLVFDDKGIINVTTVLDEVMKDIDYVFHFAALPRVPLSIEQPVLTHIHNTIPLLNILEYARKNGVKRVIYSASSSAYGDQPFLPLVEGAVEDPMNPYAAQKFMGEVYCRIYARLHELETVSLRYFNVYGPGMAFEGAYKSVIATFIEQSKAGKPLTICGDGTQTRDFTYVEDVVDANLLAMVSEDIGMGEVINIGAGNRVSINQVAGYFSGHTAINIDPRPGEIRDTEADIRKAKSLLGWSPIVDFSEGMKKTLEYYK